MTTTDGRGLSVRPRSTAVRRRILGAAAVGVMVAACAATPISSPQPSSMPTAPPIASSDPSATDAAGGGVCRGPAVDWAALPPVAQAYGKAWNERDGAARVRLLQEAWSDDGSYADPTMEGRATGRRALSSLIGAFQADRPGEYFESSAWIASDLHHGFIQMRWRLCGEDGEVLLEGVDFGELDADGRLQRVTGFFPFETERPRATCAPPAGDWSGVPEIARKWAASTISDGRTRRALLRDVFAAGGSYVDPSDERPVVGYAALDERVSAMLWEGAFFEASAWTPADSHNDYMRLRWRLCDGQAPTLEGTDFVELDETGRFLRVIGFFPWP